MTGRTPSSKPCRFLHRWTVWGEPFEQPMTYIRGGREWDGVEHRQRRTCVSCRMVEERVL